MKLDYFDLISPLPLELYKIGHIKSPKLKEIAEISYFTYAQYVSFLKMKPIDYYDNLNENSTDEIKEMIATTKYDLLLLDPNFRDIICAALNFFFEENFKWYEEYEAFISMSTLQVEPGKEPEYFVTGMISKDNYSEIVDIILQRVHITKDENEVDDLSKVKNKRGLRNYLKIHKGRKKFNKKTGGNSSLTLPNIISSVASKSNNLNWDTIWNITVFQLFDTFERLQIIDQYDVFSTQVAVWGDKEKKFKFGTWSSNIYEKD